ncbi:MAG: DUF1854 domain-containing protein [Oscillospiraceae bacterium]|nr:DUF1854 domain-containing protein [Oscillospiraceae bacterium]MDY2847874.1 DUF1854 domain-containing protein [Oscillospiraceae bacterium]
MEQEIYEVDKLNILDCDKLKFSQEESGYLTLEYEGKTYHKVNPTRLIPFHSKNEYISVNYENEEKEFREVGVIRSLEDFNDEKQKKLLSDYLEYKYHMPEITKVYSIRDNMQGAIFVKADTTCGSKTICITDWYQNFRLRDGCYLYINDADGNKYFCPDVYKLGKKDIRILENYI